MDFEHSERARDYLGRLVSFQAEEIVPREEAYQRELMSREDPWVVLPVLEELKGLARAEGLWNLFLPDQELGAGLTNVEYAPLAERMGAPADRPEVCNCNAPTRATWRSSGTSAARSRRALAGPLLAGRSAPPSA